MRFHSSFAIRQFWNRERSEAETIATKVIVGLGNPGPAYSETRHNLGFLTVDSLAETAKFGRGKRRFQALCRERRMGDHTVILVKPLTYMNLSGNAVRDLLAFHRLTGKPGAGGDFDTGRTQHIGGEPEDEAGDGELDLRDVLLVVYDDLDMPLGRLRYRARGSSGGHRGLGSVIRELKTQRFSRLKVGIGRDAQLAPEDYVLAPVRGEDKQELARAAQKAAGTISLWLDEGVVACANRFNGPDCE